MTAYDGTPLKLNKRLFTRSYTKKVGGTCQPRTPAHAVLLAPAASGFLVAPPSRKRARPVSSHGARERAEGGAEAEVPNLPAERASAEVARSGRPPRAQLAFLFDLVK